MWMPNVNRFTPRKHQALMAALREEIRSGRLNPGDRLPAQRDLSEAIGVAVGTIARVYRDAGAEGLIRSTVGRGSYVARRADAFVTAAGSAPAAAGPIDLRINQGLSAFDPPLAPALRALADAGCQDLLTYHDHGGERGHRQAAAGWLKGCGVERPAERIVLTAGAQNALILSLAACARPGQAVLTEELTYPGLREAADMLGLDLVPVAMDGQGLDPDALEAALYAHRHAAVLYTSPTIHNPTTTTQPEDRRRRIAALVARHGLWIVEDDIHRLYADEAPAPYAALLPERTFFIATLSKVVCSGLRLAFLAPPEACLRLVLRRILATHWAMSPLSAEIGARWIRDGTAAATLAAKRAEARARQAIARDILGRHAQPTQGASLCSWIELGPGWTSDGFVAAALGEGVALLGDASVRPLPDRGRRRGVRLGLGAAADHHALRRALDATAHLLAHGPGHPAGVT